MIYEMPTLPDSLPPKMPDTARRASTFIAEAESATGETSVPLEVFAPDDVSIPELLHQQFQVVKRLDKRHAKLFFQGWLENGKEPDPKLESVLDLTKDILTETKPLQVLKWSMWLGHGVLQLAEAGVRVAGDPSLIVAEGEDARAAGTQKAGELLSTSFASEYAARVRGDARNLPNTGRGGYLGLLTDTHYRFWKTKLDFGRLEPSYAMPTELTEEVKKLICQFPAKIMLADAHTLQGRPDRSLLRKVFKKQLTAYRERAQESGISRGLDLSSNLSDATDVIEMIMRACRQAGYESDESQRIVVDNSSTIGRLIERFETLENDIHFQGPTERPQLAIGYGNRFYDLPFPEADAKLKPRDQKGSVCPFRHYVRLEPGGETHEKVKLFSANIAERVGVEPSFLRDTQNGLYLDSAALMINYALLPYVHNNRG